ncbi:LemA family protein [Cellulophaga sp. E6(2014)]|uniref:LemA family protein n=1 Tax=Cellulophaga sp. E6(2014) TaxID=1495334 RepID=UPI00054DC585|nr:LemA family protein [Cellulophaga sp. E6(2014)]
MIFTYTKIVKKNKLDYRLKNIAVQFKKHFEPLPNMTTLVKNYMSYEIKLLTVISKNRSDYNETVPTSQIMATRKQMNQWVGYAAMALKNYQDFKSINAVALLQRTINEHAKQISVYVVDYDGSIAIFLSNSTKGIFGFKADDYLKVAMKKKKILDISSLI